MSASDSHLSGVALWRRIADAIRLDIVGGKRLPGERLPGETELAERFSANRHTVRRALAALQAEGVIRTEQGRGSFVDRARRVSYRIGKRTRFSENLAGQANTISRIMLSSRLENAAANVASALGLRAGSKVTRIETVALADDRPMSRATLWLGYAAFPDFATRFAETPSVTKVLASYGIADYARASTRISARHADADETAALKLAPGAILLVSEAVDTDLAGKPLLYALTRFPADLMELVV
ncbi:phosphonate metabolism transcriptional regulator PhnF [Devosia yakushimensis]|uniref:Phosphonate metabolism transcriptional regulator PhnF n=1 Tax=Devosia yakushimensis TaxID=470028 RepID=A0ABQ5UE32_9HYPH|nr:phosphonate metabolism transcriptional regulator PhnF [Devosia yakushimensis]GLQ10109.1 phosphonate metabolism transcriptional regulator PhnF [Devosia yakushimensis]